VVGISLIVVVIFVSEWPKEMNDWKAIDTFGARVQHIWRTHPLTKDFVKSGCSELYAVERLAIDTELPRCKKCERYERKHLLTPENREDEMTQMWEKDKKALAFAIERLEELASDRACWDLCRSFAQAALDDIKEIM